MHQKLRYRLMHQIISKRIRQVVQYLQALELAMLFMHSTVHVICPSFLSCLFYKPYALFPDMCLCFVETFMH